LVDAEPASNCMAHLQMRMGCSNQVIVLTSFIIVWTSLFYQVSVLYSILLSLLLSTVRLPGFQRLHLRQFFLVTCPPKSSPVIMLDWITTGYVYHKIIYVIITTLYNHSDCYPIRYIQGNFQFLRNHTPLTPANFL